MNKDPGEMAYVTIVFNEDIWPSSVPTPTVILPSQQQSGTVVGNAQGPVPISNPNEWTIQLPANQPPFSVPVQFQQVPGSVQPLTSLPLGMVPANNQQATTEVQPLMQTIIGAGNGMGQAFPSQTASNGKGSMSLTYKKLERADTQHQVPAPTRVPEVSMVMSNSSNSKLLEDEQQSLILGVCGASEMASSECCSMESPTPGVMALDIIVLGCEDSGNNQRESSDLRKEKKRIINRPLIPRWVVQR